ESASRWPTHWPTPTARASCTATSSRRTCCSICRGRCGSPTSGWPRPRGRWGAADFGWAKAEGTEELTHTGDIVGTIRFMAPERFEGKSLPQSDVYALGVTLYEILTLPPAFADAH